MDKKSSADGTANVPVEKPVATPVAPRRFTIERQGGVGSPRSERLPQIRAGQCEFCGTIDPNLPGSEQYRLCGHFRDLGEIRCSYCPAERNPAEVTGTLTLNVAEHPDKPGKLVVWCNTHECSKKHLARFQVNT